MVVCPPPWLLPRIGGGQYFFRGAAPAAGLRMNPACMAFMESQKPEMGDLVLVFPTAPLLYRIKMEFLCVDFEQIANKKSSDECLRIFVVEHGPRQSNL